MIKRYFSKYTGQQIDDAIGALIENNIQLSDLSESLVAEIKNWDTTAINSALADYITTTKLTEELNNYYTKTETQNWFLGIYGTAFDAAMLGTQDPSYYLNYNNFTNTPTKLSDFTNDSGFITSSSLPTKTSDLTNDSGFITNAVNNLTNYYLKSETYTKSEVQQLLSTISSLKLEVVTNLPTTNISSNTIYLKPLDSAKENNIYEEYIYINSKWETIGTTAVDLSNYALKTDIPTKLSQLEQDVESGGSSNIVDLGWVAQDLYGDEACLGLANEIKSKYGFNSDYIYTGTFNDEKCRFIAFYFDLEDCLTVENIGYDERVNVYNVSTDEDMIVYYNIRHYYGDEGIEIDEFGNIHLKEKELVKCMFLERINELTLQSYKVENNYLGYTEFKTWDDYVLTIWSDGFKTTFKITLQDQSDYITEQIIKLPLMSIGYANGDKEFKVKFYIDELGYVILDVRDINNEPYLYENNVAVIYEMYHITRK